MLWAQKGGASMKLNLIHAEQNEVEVTIQGDTGSEEVQRLLALLHEDAGQGMILLEREDERFLFDPDEIIYLEVFDGKTMAATTQGQYEVKEKLYQLAASLKRDGFIQINKSTLVNIHFVKSISAEFSGNYTAKIKGRNETLTISRSYFKAFKQFVRG